MTKTYFEGQIAKAAIALQAKTDEANERADRVTRDFIDWQTQHQDKIVYRDRKAVVVFAAEPAWSAASIPASVRVLLNEPAPDAVPVAGRADSAVPAASAASAGDQSGSRTGLSGITGFFGRLFQAPQRPGAGASAPS